MIFLKIFDGLSINENKPMKILFFDSCSAHSEETEYDEFWKN
jgi:hypothetical protein